MSKVRIGFVGVGSMGQCAHLVNYTDNPECEVVALAELRTGLGERVAKRYDVPCVYPGYAEMLANEALDGIVASQPFNRHGVLLPDLFQAGVPVLTEKPLSCSIEAGNKIIEALESSKARHYVGYHKRSDPATMYTVQEIDRLKASGELGALRYVRILMPAGDWVANGFAHLLGSSESFPKMEFDPLPSDLNSTLQEAYSAFVNYYIHQVNLMRHIMGENYTVSYADPKEVMMVVHGRETGVTGVIEMSPFQTTIDWKEEVLVAFTHGYIKLELPAPLAVHRPGKVTLLRDPGNGAVPETIEPQLPWIHAMKQQANNFIAAIQGEKTPLCEAAEALEDLHVARAYLGLLKGC